MMKKTRLDFGEVAREDRFMLPGIDFKSKLIGIEPVGEARGDKMCLDAMIKLKYLIKTSGEHKARIIVNVSIEGIRILDEKTREVLHQHEVHKISFISRDPTDPRAFGYVYGEQGNHKFYGIKTEKQADAVVLTLKDLFEVVLELKKQQIAEQKKADQITSPSPPSQDDSEPKQIASFKNPPPGESDTDPVYAQVNKPKLTELAADLNNIAPPSSGLLDLEKEVANLQMGIDNMEEFDLHPQSPTSPQTQPDQFATPASSDPFALPGPPAKAAAPAPAASAFGGSDPFKIQAAPTAVVNSAAPPATTSTPSNDLFKEFKDTFTTPTPQPAVNAFQGMAMGQAAPNPFGGMQTAPAPFQANFGGMGGMPAAFGGAPAAFGAAPGGYGAPSGFGAPPAPQQQADPFGGDSAFGSSVLTPEATAAAAALSNTQPARSDPFSDLGALGSTKADAPKSTKDMFANYKIGKPGEVQPAPEIKLTGGPKRPPPAIPTSPQSSMCPAIIPPSSLKLRKPHTKEQDSFHMPSPQGPPPPLPPDVINIKKLDKPKGQVNVPFAPKSEPNTDLSLPSPTNLPPPLPTYMNINDIHASVPLPEINFDTNSPPPPPPPRSKPGQLRLSTSNPLPVPPRNRIRSSQSSSPPHSPHSESASIKSCDARFFSASSPIPNRVSSPSIVSTCSALSTLDETNCEDNSSGITSNSAPSHSNSMNSLSSVFDSTNVSTDTFDNESNTASPSPSPIASSLCHDNSSTRAIDIIPSHSSLAPQPKGLSSTSSDSLYSSVETLSPSTTQSMHPSFTSNQNSSHKTRTTTPHISSSSSMNVFSTSAPVTHDSLSVAKSRSLHSISPLTLPQLPVHDDPFADDPFSRHSPSVEKTFVLNSFANFSSSTSTTTNTKSHSQNTDNVWSSHTITNMNNDVSSDVVVNSDPFGGAPVTNGNSGNSLFANQFDTFDFSTN